ncbi:Maf family protein [Metabacillus arenae]|uniref:dTTP/UTP pyrophosphatase n=1 Tax=Metabacillus arenae TaxID=2771434 RepID=A0A926RYH7_9BACI|nr:Maf family protein [Metabacillus arenae]MBD1381197.1 septum formation inhibitor Maf [Metabacillus arenae]
MALLKQHLILASGSPRRKELLENINIPFTVIVSDVEETLDNTLSPEKLVMSLAKQKADAVADRFPDSFVIGADTIVAKNGQMLGKPHNEQEAYDMLSMLSGDTHEVFTGVCIRKNDVVNCFYGKTTVTFWALSEQEIKQYIQTGEPFDKAGSYGIQKAGSVLVKEIAGDYFTVVGLPVSLTVRELRKMNFSI